jgi:tRNA U34 2-thiouridine synthase MnmA/TrmU
MTMLKTNGFAKANLSSSAHSTSFNPFNLNMGVNKEEFKEEFKEEVKEESNEELEEQSTTNPEIDITDVINSFPQED